MKSFPILKWPIVVIRWIDSASPQNGWVRLQDWEGVGSLECISVGYLIKDEDGTKTIAPHIAYPDDPAQCQGNGIIVIPDQAVLSVDKLTSFSMVPSACVPAERSSDRLECGLPFSEERLAS
jgi:hypothetical protein